MRIRRRSVVILGTAAACAVGVIAYAMTAAADPPACGPGTSTTDNKSCLNFQVLPNNPHNGARVRASLFVHTHTNYAHPGAKAQGGFAKTVTVLFDNDFAVNQTGIPKCTANLGGVSPAVAYAKCGPNGTNAKAYLSAAGHFSGHAHAFKNIPACTMVFNGPGANQVLLYTRAYTLNPVNCATRNPATESSTGPTRTTVLLTGTISAANVAGFGRKLTVPGIDAIPLPLDDFTALVKHGQFFTAKCSATPWRMRGIFNYSGGPPPPQPADVWNAVQGCS